MSIKAIIFDVDGTLISVGKNYSYAFEFHKIFRKVLRRLTGRDFSHLTSLQIYNTIRHPYRESSRILSEWGIKDIEGFWRLIEKEDYDIRKGMIGKSITPYPDAVKLIGILRGLNGSVRCGILSNAPKPIVRAELEGAGMLNFFDTLYCFNYNSPKSKPSGWGIRKMLSEWKVNPEEAWIFGDAEQDIEAGRDAGIRTAQVIRDNHPTLRTIKPDVEGRGLLDAWRKANEMQVRQ